MTKATKAIFTNLSPGPLMVPDPVNVLLGHTKSVTVALTDQQLQVLKNSMHFNRMTRANLINITFPEAAPVAAVVVVEAPIEVTNLPEPAVVEAPVAVVVETPVVVEPIAVVVETPVVEAPVAVVVEVPVVETPVAAVVETLVVETPVAAVVEPLVAAPVVVEPISNKKSNKKNSK